MNCGHVEFGNVRSDDNRLFVSIGSLTRRITPASSTWAGEGGLLDVQGELADGGMNSFTAWRKLTPQHIAFVEAMIRSKLHVIATMRAKMKYIINQTD